jgi:hypothetical protein
VIGFNYCGDSEKSFVLKKVKTMWNMTWLIINALISLKLEGVLIDSKQTNLNAYCNYDMLAWEIFSKSFGVGDSSLPIRDQYFSHQPIRGRNSPEKIDKNAQKEQCINLLILSRKK